jgi:hypothetical protein
MSIIFPFYSKKLLEFRPTISRNSLNQYARTAYHLFGDIHTDEELKKELSKEALSKTVSLIQRNYQSPSSRCLKYNVIIIFIVGMLGKNTIQYSKISQLRDECNNKYREKALDKKLSVADTQKFVTNEKYKELLDSQYERIFDMIRDETELSNMLFNETQLYHMALVYYTYSLRADLTPMDVIINKPIPDDKEKNYIRITKEKGQYKASIILNVYKTSAKYEQITLDDFEQEDSDKLALYCMYLVKRRFKDRDNVPFLSNRNGGYVTPAQLSSNFTAYFKRHLNIEFTLTLNRQRVMSSDPIIQESIELTKKATERANQLGTSMDLASTVYNKDIPK